MQQLRRIDWLLVSCILFACFAGIFTLYSQEAILGEDSPGRWYRQLIFFFIGLIIMFGMRRLNYQALGAIALPLYVFGLILLLITMAVATEIKGARSWIRIGSFGFQTSEVAKLATIILVAKYLELKERDIERLQSLFPPSLIVGVPMLLILIQPDFGGAFSLAPILLAMLFLAGADIYHIGSVVLFISVSISIPLYIEYHKITLVQPLMERLSVLGSENLLPAVRILRTDIWDFADSTRLPEALAATDRDYLTRLAGNEALITGLREAVETVRYESGGVLLVLLENIPLLLSIGGVCAFVALVLFVIRITQGQGMQKLRRFYIPLGVLGVSLLAASAFHMTVSFKYHQVARITAFINPDKFPRDLAYQIRASKAAIGSGQVTGRGFFEGDMTVGSRPLVPEAYTDFIFTSWAERTGFLGSVLLLLALILIPLRSLQIAFEARDRFGALLAAGISGLFFHHVAVNTGIALGLLPVTGLPLSFMSYGGSHLWTSMAAAGILLSIHRRRFAN